jgi:integrase
MTRPDDKLLALVQSYFQDYLERVRGASPHTRRVYADALRLFFSFLADRTGRPISRLCLDDVQADAVLAFLNHLETTRHNGVSTRNSRLVALRGFVEHLLRHDLRRSDQYRRILALPGKKSPIKLPSYLEPDQVRAILGQPNQRSRNGLRHYVLLLFLYNTGARVGEARAVRRGDLQLFRPYQVRLLGKGSKHRISPLWPDTVRALRRIVSTSNDDLVFRSARGTPLGRDGGVVDGQKPSHAAFHPPRLRQRLTGGAVAVTARVEDGPLVAAALAYVDPPAEDFRPAGRDVAQHLPLRLGQRVLLP